jgi:hypothetical protein
MKVRVKWGKTNDEETVVPMLNLPREGEFITIHEGPSLDYRFKVTFVEHLIDERQDDGIPLTGVCAIVWCKDYTKKELT